MKNWNPLRRHCVVAVLFVVAALFVAVAAVVDAIRQDSWQPVLSVGWLPAVLAAALYPAKGCWPRLRARARS